VLELPSGLHLLAAPHAAVTPADYGRLLAFLSIFYEVVILDLGPGLTAPIARLALERADQRPGPTRSARCPVAFAFRVKRLAAAVSAQLV
jgi:hypothetical protein